MRAEAEPREVLRARPHATDGGRHHRCHVKLSRPRRPQVSVGAEAEPGEVLRVRPHATDSGRHTGVTSNYRVQGGRQ